MEPAIDIWAPYARWQTWTVIAANLLPLIGIFYLGWDASTLVILYWMETAIIGLWLILRLVLTGDADRPQGAPRPIKGVIGRLVIVAFLAVHASIFMAAHLFFLNILARGEWTRHLGSPVDFIQGFVIPSGVWLPIAGMFLIRGIGTIDDIRARRPVGHVIAGFYARIVLMQFVILIGGFISLMLGSPVMLLVLIVAFKLAIDIYWDSVAARIRAAINRKPQN